MSNFNKTVAGKNEKKNAPKGANKYSVGYTKKVGGTGIVSIIARSESEAISNAKNAIKTGKDFYVLKRL